MPNRKIALLSPHVIDNASLIRVMCCVPICCINIIKIKSKRLTYAIYTTDSITKQQVIHYDTLA